MRQTYYKYLFLFYFCSLSNAIYAQEHTYSGVISEYSTGIGFPFVILEVNDSIYYFSDADGNFNFSLNQPTENLKLIHPGAHPYVEYNITTEDTLPLKFNLRKIRFPNDLCSTDQETMEIFNHVLDQKDRNNPDKKHYKSNIYNKYVVSAAEAPKIRENAYLKKILSFFSIQLTGRSQKDLFIAESASEKKYLNRKNQHEQIIGVKSTGLNFPLLYSYIIPLQYSTVYGKYFNIGSESYVSPLAGNPYKRYAFKLTNKLVEGADTIYIIRFNPLERKQINQAKGFLYIDSKDYSIKYFLATDAYDANFYFELAQQYKHVENNPLPEITITTGIYKRNTPTPMIFTVQGKTYYNTHLPSIRSLKKEKFTEIIREYEPDITEVKDEFWEEHRQTPLSSREEEAYDIYDSLGRNKRLEKLLNVGQHLYFGHIPAGKVNFETNKFLNYNLVEHTRLGAGFHTNESFSEKVALRSFFGYGIVDKRWKYGLEGTYLFNGNLDNYVGLIFNRDLNEAGNTVYPWDIPQYSSERLRNFQLHIMDYERTWKITAGYGAFKYMKTHFALAQTISEPSYEYNFRDRVGPFTFAELELGFRYAYSAKYIRMGRQIIPASLRFPVFWFLYTKGIDNFLGGNYGYEKYDVKIQHTFRTVGFGTTGVQLISGITTGDAPYSRLWNGRGALKIPSIVIHNSFETMAFNEFLSDKYMALFLSHNFGKLFSTDINFRPELVVSHNMGIGSLRNPEDHGGFGFKTMERGYFESGFFFNKLLVISISNFKTGLGLGMFFRYGPYANQHIEDNLFLKMSVLFFL